MVVQKGGSSGQLASAAPPIQNYDQIVQDPLKYVITFIEKKIRNLDKRKAKLDGYRKMVDDGKPLDPDQTAAASKYDEVLGSLDFAKDLVKTFESITTEVMKTQRKATRRELMAKEESDNNRVCFVMRVNRIMELLYENQAYKEDFLSGTNGACVVSKVELEQLVSFYELFVMKTYEGGANITEDANSAGNHMYELAEGRSKDIVGTTYKELHMLLNRITESKYFEELPDTNEVQDVHPAAEDEAQSESSGSSAEEEGRDVKAAQDGEPHTIDFDNPTSLVPNETEATTPAQDLGQEVLTKNEEVTPSTDAPYPPTHTDNTWQQQPAKPEAGDFILQGLNFQYHSGPGSNPMIQQQQQTQRHTYRQVQSIQDVLAEVQGPCTFLQDSVIDFDVGNIQSTTQSLSFMGMEIHQQQTAASLPNTHQIDQGLPVAPSLEAGFPGQNGAPIDPAATRDSHLPNAVNHSDLMPSSIESMQDSLHKTAKPLDSESSSHDTVSYHATPTQSYMASKLPASSSPSVVNQQSSMEYISHPMQNQAKRTQADNLGLGQTTFGGQQQPAGSGTNFPQDDTTNQNAYNMGSGSLNDMMQHSHISAPPSLQTPDPPTAHIPLPNEQQSGYRSYQPGDVNATTGSPITVESNLPDQVPDIQNTQGVVQDHAPVNMEEKTSVPAKFPSQMSPKESSDAQSHPDQNTRYGGRNQQSGGSNRPMRGYPNSGGYRSGPINQGGGGGNYHSQRNNYRSNNRQYGNYDSMGRPNNYSGNYQNNQSSYGMYRSQDGPYNNTYNNRRGSGGNVRGGRGGHVPRGGPRGGGNYNRSRTFRPQHSSEQAA